MHITGLVALHQERIEIEVCNHFAFALEQDVAHGTSCRRAAAGEDRVYQCAERADRVLSRPVRQTGYVDLYGMNFAHIHTHLEVAIDPFHRTAQMTGDGGERQSGNMNVADLGEVDFSFAAYAQIGAEVDLAPDPDAQFVIGADDQILWRGFVIERAKRRRQRAEEVSPVYG